MSETAIKLEDLVRDSDWAIALARRLVEDEHLAEDLRQETWLEALSAKSPAQSPRAWLTSVMRHLASSMGRSRERRNRRERIAARVEEQPSAEDLAVRLEQQQLLGREVLALAPKFRDVVLLRFFEDLPPQEIAGRLGLPVNTVYSRLSRGLTQLRERFDRQHGADGRSWIAALVPLLKAPTFAAPAAALPATVAGVVAVKTKLVAVVAIAVVVFLAIQQLGDDSAADGGLANEGTVPAIATASAGANGDPDQEPVRQLVPVDPEEPGPEDASSAPDAAPPESVPDALETRLSDALATYLTDRPNDEALRDVLVALAVEASVVSESCAVDESGILTGEVAFSGSDLRGKFQIEGDSWRVGLERPSVDGRFFTQTVTVMSRLPLEDRQTEGDLVVQHHPSFHGPDSAATWRSMGEDPVYVGWSTHLSEDDGMSAMPIMASQGPTAGTYRIGTVKDEDQRRTSNSFGLFDSHLWWIQNVVAPARELRR